MFGHLRFALIALLCATIPLFAVTIDGTVTLQGETNHSGTRILFTEASPSATTDSAFTDGSGYFSLDLAIGVYDVRYSHTGFVNIDKAAVGLTVDETLDAVELLAEASALSGLLSGTLTAGDYWVVDNISIAEESSLTIEPGTNLYFTGPYSLTVLGDLTAIGTATDSIYFSHAYSEDGNNWDGIRFGDMINGSGDSRIEHCVIEYSRSGAIHCDGGTLECHHSTFRYNTADDPMFDSCIGVFGDLSMIADCDFIENSVGHGIVYARTGPDTLMIRDCRFIDNQSSSRGIILARGFAIRNGFLIVEDCLLTGNTSDSPLYLTSSDAQISGCEISDNTCTYGGAIYCSQSTVDITNCTIADNSSDGVHIDRSPVTINSCVVANNAGYGFNFRESTDASITFCNIWQNTAGAVGNPAEGPVLLGQIVTVNQNDDSCDVYYNIAQDPMFANMVAGDFRLLENSHCIDAGDTTITDPDGSIVDIGAYYYIPISDTEYQPVLPVSHKLLSNYPNPFNPSTNIEFVVEQTGLVNLTVYDMLGRSVAELVNETMQTGVYSTHWNAQSTTGAILPSGSYWVRLNTPNQQAMHRIILLR